MPLGGIGEIGMNCYLYGLGPADARQWLMVDLGITFPEGENDPGVDVILPDLRYIEAERGNLAGLLLTHAHEDHFGAVIELWPRLRVPIYATPFTAALLQGQGSRSSAGAGSCPSRWWRSTAASTSGRSRWSWSRWRTRSRSPTPWSCAPRWARCSTPATGSSTRRRWSAAPPAPDRFAGIGAEGVAALVCDSTNAMREGRSPSERDVARSLAEIIGKAKRRVGGDDLRLQRGAHPRRLGGGARRRPAPGGGGARHAPRHRRGHGDRLSAAGFRLRRPEPLPGFPGGRGGGAVHRQPGRAARRHGAHRRRRAPRHRARLRRPRDLLLAHHPRQRARRRRKSRTGWPTSAARSSPTPMRWCMSPVTRAATS